MHRLIDSIFRQHQTWLEEGGEGALRVVRDSNLMQLVSQGLETAEADGDAAGYRRGHEQGLAAGRKLEREAYEKRAQEGR